MKVWMNVWVEGNVGQFVQVPHAFSALVTLISHQVRARRDDRDGKKAVCLQWLWLERQPSGPSRGRLASSALGRGTCFPFRVHEQILHFYQSLSRFKIPGVPQAHYLVRGLTIFTCSVQGQYYTVQEHYKKVLVCVKKTQNIWLSLY